MEMFSYAGCLLKINENKEMKVKNNVKKISAKFIALC